MSTAACKLFHETEKHCETEICETNKEIKNVFWSSQVNSVDFGKKDCLVCKA